MKKAAVLTAIFCCLFTISYSQCDTGGEPECQCSTAEVLCSVSDLDGFSSSMGDFLHPQDGPTPFCGPMSQTNNPTWFAFIAWCTDITMEVEFDNCTIVGGLSGAQLAVYTDCSFSDQVACEDDCTGGSSASLDLNGLTIGESYYVMLDGCFGSACDYSLSVSPTDCDEFIEDWEDPVTEDEVVCVGNTVNYIVDNLSGATFWHWYLDGTFLETTDNPSFEIDWDMEGIYEICVDVSNICLDEPEDPSPNCSTIIVADPNAGELTADDSPTCPNELMDISVTDFNNGPDYNEVLIFVNSEGEVVLILEGLNNYDFTWPTCEIFQVYSLNYNEASDISLPDVGDDYSGTDCMINCCDEVSIEIIFEDLFAPEFDHYPIDVTVNCLLMLQPLDLDENEELEVYDDCVENVDILGVETIQVDTCDGGTIVREWYFQDACENEVYHKQTITILPWAAPSIVNSPGDTTMSSLEYQTYMIPTLNYSNALSGVCSISGSVMPRIEDNRNGCAGFVLLIYDFEDPCGRMLSDSVRINILPDVMVGDTTVNYCDVDQTGIVLIQQSDLDAVVANDLTGVTVHYYPSETDLSNQTNELSFPISSQSLVEPNIYASVLDASGCSSELKIAIVIHGIPVLEYNLINESCFGFNDGSIEITTPGNLSGYTLTQNLDTINNSLIDSLMPGVYNLLLIDSIGCSTADTVTLEQGREAEFENVTLTCNNNNTGTDETDDFYVLEFIVTGGTGQFILNVGSIMNQGTYTYDELIMLQIPADGNNVVLEAEDVDFACLADFDLGSMTPCSSECDLTINTLDYTCQDNGTPLDGTDDYFTFSINVSALNGSALNMYNLYINNVLSYTYNYDEDEEFLLPADAQIISIVIEDLDQSNCQLTVLTDALIPCSDLCEMEIIVLEVFCVDPGTPGDNDDDLFSVELIVEGINASSTFYLSSSGETFNYGESFLLTGNTIFDGDLSIMFIDTDDPDCFVSTTIPAPPPCSSPCDIELLDLTILDCFDNMTGMDSSDDFYFVDLVVGSTLGSGTEYFLADPSGNQYGPFNYAVSNNVGPFPADGNFIMLTLSDPFNASCYLEMDIIQNSCSTCNHSLDLSADNLILDCVNMTSNIMSEVDDVVSTYIWDGPGNFSSDQADIMISISGMYELQVTYMDGCVESESIFIDVSNDMPVSNAGEDLILNCEVEEVTLTSELSQYGVNVIFNWLDDQGNILSEDPEFQISEPGEYGLLLMDTSNQCRSEIDIVIVEQFLNEPTAIIYADPGDILDCRISSIILSFEEEDNTRYDWVVNNQIVQENQIDISDPQIVSLVAIDTISGCQSDTLIEISDLTVYPEINIENIEKLDCESGIACVTATSPSTNNIEFNWLNNNGVVLSEDQGTFCFTDSGQFALELIDSNNGCRNIEYFTIAGPTLPTINLPGIITLINDETGSINPVLNVSENSLSNIFWDTDATLSCYDCLYPTILQAQDSTLVTLSITTDEGCMISKSLLIDIVRIPNIYVPNIFMPENGINFTVFSSSDITLIDKLYVFDRWGNSMFANEAFEPNDTAVGWDGTRDGQALIGGVYVYMLQYTANGHVETKYGTITLIK